MTNLPAYCPTCLHWMVSHVDGECPTTPAPKAVHEFMPEGAIVHDHADRCCREHGTHSMPHKGCILR